LDLDHLTIFDRKGCVFGFGDEGREGRYMGRGGDGGGVADALSDLLAFVDLGYFSLEELIAALAEVKDVGVRFAPCYRSVST
jgi:hypothetical protein